MRARLEEFEEGVVQSRCVTSVIRRVAAENRPGWPARAARRVALLATCALLAPPALGRVIYVNAFAVGSNTGANWTHAYTSLQSGLTSALPGDQIWVAAATYRPTSGAGRTATFQLKSGVAVYGGFLGNEALLSQRNPAQRPTWLSGDIGVASELTDNSFHVVTGSGTDATAILDGFIIYGGFADAQSGPDGFGAGLLNVNGSPTVFNCIFLQNTSRLGGGAIYNSAGAPAVTSCQFITNGVLDGYGGAVFNDQSNANVYYCAFNTNTAGGVSVSVNGEIAVTGIGYGGAISCRGGSPRIVNCTLISNMAGYGGGAIDNRDHPPGTGPSYVNCLIKSNQAQFVGGGGVFAYNGRILLQNCTLTGNAAFTGAEILSTGSQTTLNSTIVWGNPALTRALFTRETLENAGFISFDTSFSLRQSGGQIVLLRGSTLSSAYSLILEGRSGVFTDAGSATNWLSPGEPQTAKPMLTSEGYLQSTSTSCIDQGDPNLDTALGPLDIHGEARQFGRVDIGADEYRDHDGDTLPDAFEKVYFGSPISAAVPGGDADGDLLSNGNEYTLGTNPVGCVSPVDSVYGNDANPACATSFANPKRSLQSAVTGIPDASTVFVAGDGRTYSGSANRNLGLGGKRAVFGGAFSQTRPIIDLGGVSSLTDTLSVQHGTVGWAGFDIRNGFAPYGGALRIDAARTVRLGNCSLSGISTGGADALLANMATYLSLASVSLSSGYADPTDRIIAIIYATHVDLLGPLQVNGGILQLMTAFVDSSNTSPHVPDDPRRIELVDGARLLISGVIPLQPPTVITTDITGTGQIEIEAGQQLILDGNATVNITRPGGGKGIIDVKGSLVARGSAAVQNADVVVRQARITTSTPIQNNAITMKDALGSGGEFFVEGTARIENNDITSEGDRYLDLDPDAAGSHPIISNNRIYVRIDTSRAYAQGTLLELRGLDYDHALNGGRSGAYRVPGSSAGFTADPSANWVLEALEILGDASGGAKLNLTNRRGFQFQADQTHPETVYVRNLILHPGAILNTGLQRLYYEHLLLDDGSGVRTEWTGAGMPPYPQDFPNGSRIVDVPLLGFSLGNIGFDDLTPAPNNEFDVRVRTRDIDPADPQPEPPLPPDRVGSIAQVADARGPGNGVLVVQTQTASSVAVKGSFARAGDEDITVKFDYLFVANPDAELRVYLSDNPEPGVGNVEVARVRPPAPGQPGAIGGQRFAGFYGTYPRGALNFTRGTYVELVLVGPGSTVWIDNFDPDVPCYSTSYCADLNANFSIDNGDYLVLLSEYGQETTTKACLDSGLSGDQYADYGDLLGWDAFLDAYLNGVVLNTCGTGREAADARMQTMTPGNVPAGVLIAGKSNRPGDQSDVIYALGDGSACSNHPPAAGAGTYGGGRLLTDTQGGLYQLHGRRGILRYSTGEPFLAPQTLPAPGGGTAYIGMQPTGGSGSFVGVPITDAAFDPADEDTLYVCPIVIHRSAQEPAYKAAGKLTRSGTSWTLTAVYGRDPSDASTTTNVLPGGTTAPKPDLQHLREIEIDAHGRLFITTAHAIDGQNFILVYDTANPDTPELQVPLDLDRGLCPELADPNEACLITPTALTLAPDGDTLYVASSTDRLADGDTRIYRFSLSRTGGHVTAAAPLSPVVIHNPTGGDVGYGHLAGILDMRFVGSSLYAIGFTMPRFDEYKPVYDPEFDAATGQLLTLPTLAILSTGTTSPVSSSAIDCGDLALPISIAVTSPPADLNRDGVVNSTDVDLMRACQSRSSVPCSPIPPAGCSFTPDAQGRIRPDLDADGDVDLDDFAELQRHYSGNP